MTAVIGLAGNCRTGSPLTDGHDATADDGGAASDRNPGHAAVLGSGGGLEQAGAAHADTLADPVAGSLSTPTAGAKNRAYRPAPSLGSLANRYRFGDQPSARPSFHAALSSP